VIELRNKTKHVILEEGDMICDTRTGSKGFLIERERRVDIVRDDIYVWHVYWFSKKYEQFNSLPWMEEEGLKMSIVIGTVIIHKPNNGVEDE
jgi:hypothetical protein|tara:strand:+ start:852 stop:1127 length:276 start_codon:yes stop_codon:yes gene_type:complete